jgi:solute carrier family 25 (mitochondrial S-adenosylmethionine transporter), member 26
MANKRDRSLVPAHASAAPVTASPTPPLRLCRGSRQSKSPAPQPQPFRFAPLSGIRRGLIRKLPVSRQPHSSERPHRPPVASASVALADNVSNAVPLKPASDVLAGAVARAASQSTIHPIDTLKVRLQTTGVQGAVSGGLRSVSSLYKGVTGAACGAGIALGAYFAFYGAACNLLSRNTRLSPSAVAFVGGGAAAAGSSVVKVPLAVCIRSVQAGIYPNAIAAGQSIVKAAGVRGLFTGYAPTLLEDIPDMSFKFAAYETLRQAHRRLTNGRSPNFAEDFLLGAISGAVAAAATTPLDVLKTNMMCTAVSRPSMRSAARDVYQQGGTSAFFRGVWPRAASNAVNSAVFFCFFEAIRRHFAEKAASKRAGMPATA